uniref:Uncharacterized protein n=1 Tax=Arundo donax TaxID=35708 RepID=A0A0A9BUJ8_ARUDO
MAPRRPLFGTLLLALAVVLAQLGALSCEGDTLRLRGSVACLDCAAGHDLSGVVVAVKCAGDDGTGLHAAQTDGRGNFNVAMPASASACAARVLGAAEQLCAPQRLTVARVVPGRRLGSSYYALGSHLAFFTGCGPSVSSAGATTTLAASDQREPMPPAMQTPVGSLPRAEGNSPPFGMGGLPLIYFFPFLPIIGIP